MSVDTRFRKLFLVIIHQVYGFNGVCKLVLLDLLMIQVFDFRENTPIEG